jgi:hypothetical protein
MLGGKCPNHCRISLRWRLSKTRMGVRFDAPRYSTHAKSYKFPPSSAALEGWSGGDSLAQCGPSKWTLQRTALCCPVPSARYPPKVHVLSLRPFSNAQRRLKECSHNAHNEKTHFECCSFA